MFFYNHETFRAKLRAYREPSLVTLLFDLSVFACEVKSWSVLINVCTQFALSMSLFWFKGYLAWNIGPLIPRDYSLKIIMSNKQALAMRKLRGILDFVAALFLLLPVKRLAWYSLYYIIAWIIISTTIISTNMIFWPKTKIGWILFVHIDRY